MHVPLIIGAGILVLISVLYYPPKSILVKYLHKNKVLAKYDTPNKKTIFLTIDDVPYKESFEKIVDVLNKYNTRATFFVISDFITNKNTPILLNAITSGHELANHGKTNKMAYRLTSKNFIYEIDECNRALINLYRKAGKEFYSKFYRPGCGFFHEKMIKILDNKNMTLVLGSVYPYDPQISSSTINLAYLKSKISPGDIIVIHDRNWTIPLLEKLIPWLKNNNFDLLTLSDSNYFKK